MEACFYDYMLTSLFHSYVQARRHVGVQGRLEAGSDVRGGHKRRGKYLRTKRRMRVYIYRVQ